MTHVPDGWRQRLSEIETRAENAVAGPWDVDEDWTLEVHEQAPSAGRVIAKLPLQDRATASFILHARDDIPWLISLVRSMTQPPASGEGDALRLEDIQPVEDSRIVPRAYLDHILGVLEQMPAKRDDDLYLAIGQTRAHIEIPAPSPSLAEEVGRLREALKPFAQAENVRLIAEECERAEYQDANIAYPPPSDDAPYQVILKIGHFRRAKEALSTSLPPTQERDEAWEGMLAALKALDKHWGEDFDGSPESDGAAFLHPSTRNLWREVVIAVRKAEALK